MVVKEGMQVEVYFDAGGSKSSWVEGVVRSINGNICVINLKILKTNEKSLRKVKRSIRKGEVLVEVVLSDVRPIPPHTHLPVDFLPGMTVEARDSDCWWRGFIVRQVPCEGRNLWLVSLSHNLILKAFPRSDLRPAQEWRGGGNWISVPQVCSLGPSSYLLVLVLLISCFEYRQY